MAYIVDNGIWSSVFAVPSAIVDQHIKICSRLCLQVLLLMLRYPGQPVDEAWLAQHLSKDPADISDALHYWINAGIIFDTDRPAIHCAPAREESSAAFEKTPSAAPVTQETLSASGQKIVTVSARPKITRSDIAQMSQDNPAISQLLIEAQSVIGSPLTPVESEILVAIVSYYGMEIDVLLMLLQFCVSIGKASMNYVEKAAASWLEKGINTHELAELEITRLTRNNQQEKIVIEAFGLYNRSMTPKEKELVNKWFDHLGLSESLITLACQRSMENTGKISFAYADKILTSWSEKGIKTPAQAIEELNSAPGKKNNAGLNKSAQTGKYSSLDADELDKLLHQLSQE